MEGGCALSALGETSQPGEDGWNWGWSGHLDKDNAMRPARPVSYSYVQKKSIENVVRPELSGRDHNQ